jgi:hypothetical protein
MKEDDPEPLGSGNLLLPIDRILKWLLRSINRDVAFLFKLGQVPLRRPHGHINPPGEHFL